MSLIERWQAVALLCAALHFPCAAQLPFAPTNAPGYRAQIRVGETVGNEQVRRAFLTVGTNQLMFRIPTGFQLDASSPERVVLANLDRGVFISMQVIPPTQGNGSSWKPRATRLQPDATVVEELTEYALNRHGPAFDLRWTQSGAEQKARIAFIPLKNGTLELSLLTSGRQFDDARLFYRIVVSSLQSDENGPIVISPLPDFS